jgi:methylmalonyl-CoA/ethylmalonyl-CoA epimerase
MITTTGLHHIGILVETFADIERMFGKCLGLELGPVEPEPALGIEILWVDAHGVRLEFIRPLRPESLAAQAIRAGGLGVHHLAFAVDGVNDCLAEFRAAGIGTLDHTARPGARGSSIAFLDPAFAAGTRVELVQEVPDAGHLP